MTSFINLNTSDTIETFNNVSKTSDRPLSICHGPTASPSDYFCKIIGIFKFPPRHCAGWLGLIKKKKTLRISWDEVRDVVWNLGLIEARLKGKGVCPSRSHDVPCGLKESSISTCSTKTIASLEFKWLSSLRTRKRCDHYLFDSIFLGRFKSWLASGHLPNFTSWPTMKFYLSVIVASDYDDDKHQSIDRVFSFCHEQVSPRNPHYLGLRRIREIGPDPSGTLWVFNSLHYLDQFWFIYASRSARWMD